MELDFQGALSLILKHSEPSSLGNLGKYIYLSLIFIKQFFMKILNSNNFIGLLLTCSEYFTELGN